VTFDPKNADKTEVLSTFGKNSQSERDFRKFCSKTAVSSGQEIAGSKTYNVVIFDYQL
jgi:hypothetical protein